MGIIFENGFGIGTVPNYTNGGSGQWYLATGDFGYQPAWTYGVVSWPMGSGNYGSNYGTNDPSEILSGGTAGVYISAVDSTNTPRYDLISALVNRTGTITFTQGANHVIYGFTPGTFVDITNMYGSIAWSYMSQGSLTLISSSNTTFTGYSDGDNNHSYGGPLTYTGSTIPPNNSELVTITYTTDAPSFTLTSDMFDAGQYSGPLCNNPKGMWNGFSGFTVSQTADLACGVTAHLSNATQIHNAFVAAGVSAGAMQNWTGYICDVVWGSGSTVTYGVAKVSFTPTNGNQINITTVDPTDSNYLNNNNNAVGTSLVGTFNFPARFTFRTPLDAKGGWC